MKNRRVKVPADTDQLVVAPVEEGPPLLFRRSGGSLAVEGAWERPPEGQPLPAASLVILPTGLTLARMVDLPEASEANLEAALQLQASTLLLGSVPLWRSGQCLLPRLDQPGGRQGVVVEWPGTAEPDGSVAHLPPEGDPLFASDLSCLLAMLCAGASGPLVAVRGDRSVVSFCMRLGGRIVVRVARIDPTEWPTAAEVSVLESGVQAGADAAAASRLLEGTREAFAAAGASGFGCTDEDRLRLCGATGLEGDAAWWARHGLAVGAALAWFGPLRPIVSLRAAAPGERAGALGLLLNRLSDPRLVRRLVIAAAVSLAVVPPAVAGARLLLLQWKVGDLAARERAVASQRERLAMYEELQRRAWPMAKLLGDLASVTPEGVDWENVQLSQDRNVSLTASARPHDGLSASEVILRMERQMRDSRVFDRIQKKWDPQDAKGSVSFTISASVSRPTLRPGYPAEQDFARRTLSERRYGPAKPAEPGPEPEPPPPVEPEPSPAVSADASPVPAAPVALVETPATKTEAAADASAPTSKGLRRPSSSGGSGGLARRSERTPDNASEAIPVPPPLSDAQIAAMTSAEIKTALNQIAAARQNAAIDPETSVRLKSELYKLLERSRVLEKSKGTP